MAYPRKEEANTKELQDYFIPTIKDTIFGIRKPIKPTNKFEIKPIVIQIIQDA